MKKIIFLFFMSGLFLEVAFAGDSGGGIRVSPQSQIFQRDQQVNVDYIKAIKMTEEGMIKFKFKAYDKEAVEHFTVNKNDIDAAYLDALKKSAFKKSWEAVDTIK